MNKEIYTETEMEVIMFEETDIIITSGGSDEPTTGEHEMPIVELNVVFFKWHGQCRAIWSM